MSTQTELRPRLRVNVFITNDKDEVLLIQEPIKSRNDDLYWLTPGGGVEFGETLEEAVIREAREESGLEVEIVKFIDYRELLIPEHNLHTLQMIFLTKAVGGDVLKEPKAKDISWFSKDEALKLQLSESTRDYLSKI